MNANTPAIETLDGFPAPAPAARPSLPEPTRTRWQPLRLGLVELFHYDAEEFWFRDGHLLLRGNNGTGKSKVLSLTLPFLFDARLSSARIEPDGDAGKKMAWNLLMGSYDRRIGYAWIEFGRLDADGMPHYLTLGAGLSAAAARAAVDSWFFILEADPARGTPAPRLNQDLWLTNETRTVHSKENLRRVINGWGQIFDTGTSYRRAVDERLFHLGPARYDALMDTLIQLRQPQLSKKPDEASLSQALTEALPPLAGELLADVAQALSQLEEDRLQLEEYQSLARAVERFNKRYRVYAGTQTRRQARALRQAQTEFDNASQARTKAQTRLDEARADEAGQRARFEQADLALAGSRARLDALREDPAMQDANRLESAAREAAARQLAMDAAELAVGVAGQRLAAHEADSARTAQRAEAAGHRLAELRSEAELLAERCSIASTHAAQPLAALDTACLADLSPRAFEAARGALRAAVVERREQIGVLRKRHAERTQADALLAQRHATQTERQQDAEDATARRTDADAEVERQAGALNEAWERCFAQLTQLRIDPAQQLAVLDELALWTLALDGANPARQALQVAQQDTSQRLAQRGAGLAAQGQTLNNEARQLVDERERIDAGVDAPPLAPPTRDPLSRHARAGAPLWQLVEFRDAVIAPQRAGLEAALEAAGLLDAWVAPDGQLQTGDGGATLLDTQVLNPLQPPSPHPRASLADWLHAGSSLDAADAAVSSALVTRLLESIACSDTDGGDSDAWVATDGRFRLAALAGAWNKPTAAYIGVAARAAARARRLGEIATRLAQIDADLAALRALLEQLTQDQQRAGEEWRLAPPDDTLRQSHLSASASAKAAQQARERLALADDAFRSAQALAHAAREHLATDAADLRLPNTEAALSDVDAALGHYNDTQLALAQAAHELRLAQPELQRQQTREAQARDDLRQRDAQAGLCRIEAKEAQARAVVLREAVGALVEALQRQLAQARDAVNSGEATTRLASDALRLAGEARAAASEQANSALALLTERSDARALAVLRWQQFAVTGLLATALPDIELTPADTSAATSADTTATATANVPAAAWTIDRALTLARRAEQALTARPDDDSTWAAVQRQIAEELTELQRALSALGHQAPAEPCDWGLVVHIVYMNRSERPDRLEAQLSAEIAQRSELLTANERAVLENHLQAEIAAEVQRLLQAAVKQVGAINTELHKRPTSTGVRFRLVWEPLAEADGAPVGLEAARKRLLNTSADLWSVDDRRVVGAMLQQRIVSERERVDAGLAGTASSASRDLGASLHEQLARALDYRRWHRFRVERWQEGTWRKLSGPASSGERALGLTVPLFAAIASFYSQGSHALAPRLMLLDEAFAGIDDAARAHCMGLIARFDLDFVITSEREWACYAELPGVAICQLQRREGVDAVHVSRWSWDGRAKRQEADPQRRFADELLEHK